MRFFQFLFSVLLWSEVLSIIDKRVINNKNSDKNEGKLISNPFYRLGKPHMFTKVSTLQLKVHKYMINRK